MCNSGLMQIQISTLFAFALVQKKAFLNDRDNLYLGLFEGGKKIEEQEAPSFFFYLSFARGNVQKRMV